MKEFGIRIASHLDRARVIELMSRFYAGDMGARYDWMYLSNPHGRALTWLAVETLTGEAVGCTSIFPRKVMVDGRERMGAIGGDCFVLPRARRQGLATALHRASFKEMGEMGIDFMYGPPVPENLAALVKAGSHVVTNYKRWVRPLSSNPARSTAPARMEARLAYLPIMVFERLTKTDARGFSLEVVKEFGPEFDRMFEQAARTHSIACVRDRHYLRWRYFTGPAGCQVPLALKLDGEVVAFIALEMAGPHAAVADIFSPNDSRLIETTLQLALKYAARAGCSSMEISLTQRCGVARRLRRLGFIGREERGFQVAVAERDSQFDRLLDPLAWHFTEADQDMVTVFPQPATANLISNLSVIGRA